MPIEKKKSVRNFTKKANVFEANIKRGKGVKQSVRDWRGILVGVSHNKGLVAKRQNHFGKTLPFIRKFEDAMKKQDAKTFFIVPAKADINLGIQQYFAF